MQESAHQPERPTRLFLSWAHNNEHLKERLIRLLLPRLSIQTGVSFEWWEDSHLWLGEDWRRGIVARAHEADYALQLLSPEFFASPFIATYELPPFVGPQAIKGCLPVGLSRISLDGSQNMRGVDEKQIWRLDTNFFAELRGHRRELFCSNLAGEIRRRVLGRSQWRAL